MKLQIVANLICHNYQISHHQKTIKDPKLNEFRVLNYLYEIVLEAIDRLGEIVYRAINVLQFVQTK